MKNHELLTAIDLSETVNLCRDLIRYNTVNPPGSEAEIAEFIAKYLEKAGLSCELLKHSSKRASLIARIGSTQEVPPLIYCGHMDVVPEGKEDWLYDPFLGELADGKIWGRGSSDMKSGLAAMILAAKAIALHDLELKGDLILAITADEEVDQLGAKELVAILENTPAQAIMIPEPSNNEVFIAEKGQLWLEVTTHGKAAHGSMPRLGKNAITMMVLFLNELKKIQFEYDEHALLGGFTKNIGTIQGGTSTNIVPDRCVLTMDLRTVPGQNSQEIIEHIKILINRLNQNETDFSGHLRVITDLCPVETDLENPLVQQICRVIKTITGTMPKPGGVSYTTDAAILAPPLKSAMVICGPGEPSLAHQPDEYVEIDRLMDSVKIFTLVAAELLT